MSNLKLNNMNDLTNGRLQEALKLARQRKDQSLIHCLKRLRMVEKNHLNTNHNLMADFAPYSLYFERFREEGGKKIFTGNGGIIFHGAHDGGGNGSGPTFSVNLIPCDGWSIHT